MHNESPSLFKKVNKHNYIINANDFIFDINVFSNATQDKLRIDLLLDNHNGDEFIIDNTQRKNISIHITKSPNGMKVNPAQNNIKVLSVSYNQKLTFANNINIYKSIQKKSVLQIYVNHESIKEVA